MHRPEKDPENLRIDRDFLRKVSAMAIRPRWLVAAAIAVVGAIGGMVYVDETNRSEAALADLGEEQAAIARAAGGEPVQPGQVRITDPGVVPGLREAIAAGASVFRVPRSDAPRLGLPARTAMIGIARTPDGKLVAYAASAERRRDRDFAGRTRVLGAMLLASAVMALFGVVLWRQQRAEAVLARELAVAETARARDAELDRLSRAATMAALGSGVAHELGTPLGVIVGRAEQIAARANGDERIAKNAAAILEQAEHIDRVVRGFLGLARGAPIALQEVTARELVGEAAALVAHRFARADVHLIPAVSGDLPPVRCEPLLFKHALVNLMLNACEASPARGHVRVEVAATDREIAFTVTDEGEGMPDGAAARAVEPFFTTKPSGTGLGLAIANEIAKTHRGTLELSPRSPHGTVASITIPVSA